MGDVRAVGSFRGDADSKQYGDFWREGAARPEALLRKLGRRPSLFMGSAPCWQGCKGCGLQLPPSDKTSIPMTKDHVQTTY